MRKCRTVALTWKSTEAFAASLKDDLESEPEYFHGMHHVGPMMTVGGGVPVVAGDALVGIVAVSSTSPTTTWPSPNWEPASPWPSARRQRSDNALVPGRPVDRGSYHHNLIRFVPNRPVSRRGRERRRVIVRVPPWEVEMADAMETIDAAGGAGSGLFLRKATGLVRDISPTDAFLFNAVGMNVGLGALFMLTQAPAFFPNGNMVIAAIIGTLIMAFSIQWVYSEFSAAMPRSGGDYVFTSRAIHPFIGWILGWNQAIWLIFFWIGFNAWALCQFTLPPTLQVLAQTTGIAGLADVGTAIAEPLWTFVIGSIVNVLFAYLVLTRRFWGWQRVTIVFAFAAVLIPAILVLLNGAGGLKTAWDGFVGGPGAGLTYDQIVPKAQELGYAPPSGGFRSSAARC